MRKFIAIYAVIAGVVVVSTGCTQQIVKHEKSAINQTAGQKEAKYAVVPPARKPNESPGIAGGTGQGKKDGSDTAALKKKYRIIGPLTPEVIQFYANFDKAEDKLGFLLANADTDSDAIAAKVAGLLGNFDDPRSIEALKKLREYQVHSEDAYESVAQNARVSLQWIEAKHDLKKLAPDMSADELDGLAKKYATGNDTAHKVIFDFIQDNYNKNPDKYVPILIKYYAHTSFAVEVAKQYPELADKGLDECLSGTNASTVAHCVQLIGQTGKAQYSQRICDMAFFNKGNINYQNDNDIGQLQSEAFFAYYYLGSRTIPYLEKILYSKYLNSRSRIVGRMEFYNTPESIAVLKRFQKYCQEPNVCSETIRNEVAGALNRLGALCGRSGRSGVN